MPLLDDDDLKRMREWKIPCAACHEVIRKNYCRQCDEFFTYGHLKDCILYSIEHMDHRTY